MKLFPRTSAIAACALLAVGPAVAQSNHGGTTEVRKFYLATSCEIRLPRPTDRMRMGIVYRAYAPEVVEIMVHNVDNAISSDGKPAVVKIVTDKGKTVEAVSGRYNWSRIEADYSAKAKELVDALKGAKKVTVYYDGTPIEFTLGLANDEAYSFLRSCINVKSETIKI